MRLSKVIKVIMKTKPSTHLPSNVAVEISSPRTTEKGEIKSAELVV
jgi:hypothetical protein